MGSLFSECRTCIRAAKKDTDGSCRRCLVDGAPIRYRRQGGPLRAIDTAYNGRFYRSRQEARFAVLFDWLGVSYDYEPEGYEVDGLRYLPDFLLPEAGWFLEIKGADPSPDELRKCAALALHTACPVIVHVGTLTDPTILPLNTCDLAIPDLRVFDLHECLPAHLWRECKFCGGKLAASCRVLSILTGWSQAHCPAADIGADHQHIRLAYRQACTARFEHGETPQLPTEERGVSWRRTMPTYSEPTSTEDSSEWPSS